MYSLLKLLFAWGTGLMVVVETVHTSVIWEMLPRYPPTPTLPLQELFPRGRAETEAQ